MIATLVVELGRKMPQLIGHLLPGQAQLDPARVKCRVQRGAVKAADHDIRHRVIVPFRGPRVVVGLPGDVGLTTGGAEARQHSALRRRRSG